MTYAGPDGGSYAISGAGTPTTAPSGAVYMTGYTSSGGTSYPSYHYDPSMNAYYNITSTDYNVSTGMYTTPSGSMVPAWSGIGLGNEYSYVNTAAAGAPPSYQTYGGGGAAMVNPTPGPTTAYDYQFMYTNGSYYDGTVVDNGTFGYKVGMTIPASDGTYSIYAQATTPPPATAKAGYNYIDLYYSAGNGMNYTPADMIPSSPTYQKADGYGGLGTEKDYIQTAGGYSMFSNSTPASSSTPIAAIPLPT